MSDQEQRLPTPAAGSFRAFLQAANVRQRFEEVLNDRAPQFIASLSTIVYASNALKNCDQNSIIAAALKAAALDLPIEPSLGFAAIVPYKGVAVFQMQWKGYVQLALRTQQYKNINVTETYPGMVISVDPWTGVVSKGQRSGDEVTGYYSYFKLTGGFEKEVYMSLDAVMAHGKRYSPGFNDPRSTWKTNPDAMGLKTVIKRLLTRYGIMSVEMRAAIESEKLPDEPDETPETSPEQRARDKTAIFPEDPEPDTAELYTREQAEAETK